LPVTGEPLQDGAGVGGEHLLGGGEGRRRAVAGFGAVGLQAVVGYPPVLSWRLLLACGAAMLVGIGGGHWLARWLPETATRRWVLGLALTGSVIACRRLVPGR
jgi:hypothetical protein